MADRRMFAKTIIDSDAFLDMPVTSRLLYYDLSMRADDDGFVNAPKKIMRIVGATQDDLNILVYRKFVIPFENGVIVIKHWRLHNYIRKDRYTETKYKEQKATLELDENGAYRMKKERLTSGCQLVDEVATQDRVGKDSIDQDSIDSLSEDSIECSDSNEDMQKKKTRKKPEKTNEPPVFQIPLNDGTMYDVTQSEIDMYTNLYPAVDIQNQMRAIVGWNMSNPKKRKTRSGIKRHINTWLADKQNNGGGRRTYSRPQGQAYTPVPASLPEDGYDNHTNPFKKMVDDQDE